MSCSCGHKHPAPAADVFVPALARIARTEALTAQERLFELRLESGKPLGHQPGQFVEISLPGLGEAPISVSSAPDKADGFELVVRKVGRLTEKLHTLGVDARVGVRGPFGTSFPVSNGMVGGDVCFICGGIGLVPVRAAIHHVLSRRAQYGKVTILYGTKSPADRLFRDELRAWAERKDVEFLESVDRGDPQWQGNVGVITTLIPKMKLDPRRAHFIVCGPPVMYKFVLIELFTRGVAPERVYVSLERRMKCGVGKCGHCQINGLYTCLDGPVFKFSDLGGIEEAI